MSLTEIFLSITPCVFVLIPKIWRKSFSHLQSSVKRHKSLIRYGVDVMLPLREDKRCLLQISCSLTLLHLKKIHLEKRGWGKMQSVWWKQLVFSSALKATCTAGSGNLHHFSGTEVFTFRKANLRDREVSFTYLACNTLWMVCHGEQMSKEPWDSTTLDSPLTLILKFLCFEEADGFFSLQKSYSLLPPLIYPSWICWFGHSHVFPPKL